MNMRKKHGKTLSSVVDSRRKFGERHILRDGLRLRRGVGNQRVPWAHLNSDEILLLVMFKFSEKATKMLRNLPLSFDETCQVKTKRMVALNYCGLLRKFKL